MPQTTYLSKGQRVNCGKNAGVVTVAINWSNLGYNGAYELETDLSAFVLYDDGKVKSDDDFIFYNNPVSKDGAVEMAATGPGEAEVNINLSKLDRAVSKIAITLTIYDANARMQNFGHMTQVSARLFADGSPIAVYSVDKSGFKSETAIVVCEVYRYKDEWRFAATGAGYKNGLAALCGSYGVMVKQQDMTHTVNKKPPKKPKKQAPPKATRQEISGLADSILTVWKSADFLLRENNPVAAKALREDPEAFDATVFVPLSYMSDKIKVERGLKSEIIKKFLKRTNRFTGLELVELKTMSELIDGAFDRLNFVEVKSGPRKTDAASLYSIIICAIGQLLLLAAQDLTREDAAAYRETADILGVFDRAGAYDILAAKCDISGIKQLNEWYEKYIASGEIFGEDEESLEDLLDELNALVGLKAVKDDVNSLINMIRIQQKRKEQSLPVTPVTLHLVFSGNPGTGKTTVARLVARIYKALGLLKKGHLIEADRSKLVAGYVGQTAIRVKEAIDSAIGGVLFIDEAYALTSNKGNNDFGQEAVDTLLKYMEDLRGDFIVITAGYTEQMKQFLQSNPGLLSRFNKFIQFEDYNPRELTEIFIGMCAKAEMILSRDAQKYAAAFFAERYNNRSENFANARDVRNFFEKMLIMQANRLAEKNNLTKEDLSYIKYEDVSAVKL